MIRKRNLVFLILLHFLVIPAFPGEGMWIPLLIEKFNITDMQQKGFKLSAEDIYSINKACLADAVILFGHGCTGEVISPEGLILTNYHCGLSRIQSHSSLEKDYISDGFWAYSREEELPNSGLAVSFLKKIEEVTERVQAEIGDSMPSSLKKAIRDDNIRKIIAEATENTTYNAEVKSFYYGSAYYIFVYETFRDVRLVGAPPASIGKFGGDTDNWIWPRHTGDFSLFRIYADSLNRPADYSTANIPYTPRKSLTISLRGIHKNDFTMVLGYPAKTDEYLVSDEIGLIAEESLPVKIKLRETRMDIIASAMKLSDEVRLEYTSKYAGISNAWKKWIGVLSGFQRIHVMGIKEGQENEFQQWINGNPDYGSKYGNLLADFKDIYTRIKPYYMVSEFGYETIMGIELLGFVSIFTPLLNFTSHSDQHEFDTEVENLRKQTNSFFANYSEGIDRKIFARMMEMYYQHTGPDFHPEFYNTVYGKFKGDYTRFTDYVFNKSAFTSSEKTLALLNSMNTGNTHKIMRDPAFRIFMEFSNLFGFEVYPEYDALNDKLDSLYRVYISALKLQSPDKVFYPDANFTMRISYGKVEGYSPADAVHYSFATTLKGVMEKEDPDIYDYKVPDRLKALYNAKDYGRYGQNDTMYVCFVASNHTSGGNSGSPVLDANGYLIGLNFDRNWEGTVNDYFYDPEICRNISVDIRYVLFIIDKYAQADNIISELTIIE